MAKQEGRKRARDKPYRHPSEFAYSFIPYPLPPSYIYREACLNTPLLPVLFSYLIAIEGTPAPEPVPAHVAPNNRARNLNLKGADGTPSLLNGSETR